jgi:murein DD-endopeptidase MepM/ murein hydrolase activator NlpD
MPIRRAARCARLGRRLIVAATRMARVARCARLARVSVWIAAAIALGCASTPQSPDSSTGSAGVTHILQPGENLYRLSRFYGVPVDTIARANQISDVTKLEIGQRIWIPGAKRGPSQESLAAAGAGSAARYARDLHLIWPVKGKVSSLFGRRNGRSHDGIDIPAEPGTLIHAAAAGRVIHSGRGLGDYGRVVIIKHEGYYSTVYAHNRRNRVEEGDFVEKGDVIGEVGSSGNATGPHVHFEVRRNREPIDPLLFLP